MKKDLKWEIEGVKYSIKNVPYDVFESDETEYLTTGDSIKCTALRDLMVAGEIPLEVDFEDFIEIEF